MHCSKCGGDTQVIATRSPQKPGRGAEVNKANKTVAWYTHDYVVRNRRCRKCGWKTMTVELLLDDVNDMMRESAEGHAPDLTILNNKERS